METIRADVAILGAGGAGLRAAIALAETNPGLSIALVSKVYPMRSHACAAGVIKADDGLEHGAPVQLVFPTAAVQALHGPWYDLGLRADFGVAVVVYLGAAAGSFAAAFYLLQL